MKINIRFDQNNLPDKYGKYADLADKEEGKPIRSFPFDIVDVPKEAKYLAFSLIDYDATPVCGFPWIHWTVANLPVSQTSIPENFSQLEKGKILQGKNSSISPLLAGKFDEIVSVYTGPMPPDQDHLYTLTVYALSAALDLKDGFFYNEMINQLDAVLLDEGKIVIKSRV